MTTIRERLTRQAKVARWTMLGGIALIMVVTFVLEYHHVVPRVAIRHYIFAGAVLMSGVSFLMQRRIEYPRCNARIAEGAPAAWLTGIGINFCPKCGANFNEPA